MKQVMIVAAEASSSLFALRLLEHWKNNKADIKAFGVGSNAMEALGFERFGKAENMAVVGIAEVVEHYSLLKEVFNRLVEEARLRRPSVVVLMDYPDFNLMLAKKLHEMQIPVVYYISPQIWAWRKGRVKKIKKYCREIFVLFPFEVKFYEEQGVPVQFVGHPLLDELGPQFLNPSYRRTERQRRGIQDSDFVLGLMPGSRKSEIALHLETQLEVARKLVQEFPQVKIALLVAPTFTREQMQEKLEDVRFPYMLMQDEPFEMIHLTDMILVASGTATLQVGLMKKPMVIMYKMKWLTYLLARMIVRGVKFFGLVNLIMDKEVVPECWQHKASVENLAVLLRRYVVDPAHRLQVETELGQIESRLGSKGATGRVARALNRYLSPTASSEEKPR
jgi:lipid-A-disaccharide synthase